MIDTPVSAALQATGIGTAVTHLGVTVVAFFKALFFGLEVAAQD